MTIHWLHVSFLPDQIPTMKSKSHHLTIDPVSKIKKLIQKLDFEKQFVPNCLLTSDSQPNDYLKYHQSDLISFLNTLLWAKVLFEPFTLVRIRVGPINEVEMTKTFSTPTISSWSIVKKRHSFSTATLAPPVDENRKSFFSPLELAGLWAGPFSHFFWITFV